MHLATIDIRNLRLRTFIGFKPEERVKKQDIVVHLKIGYTVDEAALNDEVEHALDYKHITKEIISFVEGGSFLLLERLVSDVLSICRRDSRVRRARVTIEKPHALRFADSVSLTLDYDADSANSLRLLEKAS